MDAKFAEQILGYIPLSLVAIIVTALLKVSMSSIKHIVTTTYEEMIENNQEAKKQMAIVLEKLSVIERDTYEIKSMLSSFVTVEKHYAYTKGVNRDVSDMRERVARIEGRTTP